MSVAASSSAQAPSASNGISKPARPLSPRAKFLYTVGLYLAMATFAVAVCGLMIVADVENTSWLSHTTLGAKVRPLLTRKPFLVGGFFNTGAFGAVMAFARLQEHQRYLEDERAREAAGSQPKSSRQERRRAEAERSKEVSRTRRQVEESMRAMGARVFVEKGGKVA